VKNSLKSRLKKLESEHGEGKQGIAMGLFSQALSRADALRILCAWESDEADVQNRMADPHRPLDLLHLFDDATHLHLIIHGGLDHRRATNLAYDFREWSRAEVATFAAASKFGAPINNPALDAIAGKIETLMDRAEAIWHEDERLLAGIVAEWNSRCP
jgi:hypothetical protein